MHKSNRQIEWELGGKSGEITTHASLESWHQSPISTIPPGMCHWFGFTIFLDIGSCNCFHLPFII